VKYPEARMWRGHYFVKCPGCTTVMRADADQIAGRVSLDCPVCSYHETTVCNVIGDGQEETDRQVRIQDRRAEAAGLLVAIGLMGVAALAVLVYLVLCLFGLVP